MSRSKIKAGSAFVEIGLRNRVAAGAKAVQADLRRLGTKLRSQGQSIMTAGLAASAGAVGLLAAPVRAASGMEETLNKFTVVFGKNAKSVQSWSNTTAKAYGTSRREMMSMLAGMQDLLVPMGVAEDQAEGMSKEFAKLAVDLGSWDDSTTEEAFDRLMAAVTGSGEVMKKYGVVLTEAAVKQELLAMGMDPKATDNAAKAQARMNIIMRGTTASQSDAIRSANSFANQTKRLKANLEDTAATIGGPILGTLAKMMEVVNGGIASFMDFAESNKDLLKTVGLVAVSVAGIGIALVTAGGALATAGFAATGLAAAMSAFGASLAFVMSPLTVVIGGVTALGFAIVNYMGASGDAIDWLKDRFGPLVKTVSGAAGEILTALQLGDLESAWELTVSLLEVAWLDLTKEIRSAWMEAMHFVLDIGSAIAGQIGSLFEGLAGMLDGLLSKYESLYNSIYESVIAVGQEVSGVKQIGSSGNAFRNNFGSQQDALRSRIDGVRQFGQNMRETSTAQIAGRMQEREQARTQRQSQLSDARQKLEEKRTMVAERVQQAEEKRENDLSKIQSEVDARQKNFAITQGELTQQQKATGPTGTFSAFAATGLLASPQERREEIGVLKEIARNTEDNGAAFA
ncbi:MAG: hypothetical protein AAFV88_13330 [Planctomycetota bacterium]